MIGVISNISTDSKVSCWMDKISLMCCHKTEVRFFPFTLLCGSICSTLSTGLPQIDYIEKEKEVAVCKVVFFTEDASFFFHYNRVRARTIQSYLF